MVLVVPAIATPFHGAQLRELLLPITEHMRFDAAQVSHFTNGEISFCRDGRQGRPFGGGLDDNSGIVTTYEDMAKDDSFKTKKLPHPNDKKKGFFDGLFKKEK